MRSEQLLATVVVVVFAVLATAASTSAQSLGTFRWQLQPFCNQVTVNVSQSGGSFTLDGFDDQCGASRRVPLTGLATPNPDGTLEFGLALVVSTGLPLHITARVNVATVSGTWLDSQGQGGTFAFNASTPGLPARPVPTSLLPDGTVTAGKIAPAAVDALALASGAVTASKIAANAIASSTFIATNTIEMSDLRRISLVGIGFSPFTVPANGCVVRESAFTTLATDVGDLAIAAPGPASTFPPGIYTLPMTIQVAGRIGVAFCNATAADITSGFSVTLSRIPR